jgi:hypothetical protein
MPNAAIERDVIEVLATEIYTAVQRGVEYWMSQVESALHDKQLTALGRLQRVHEIAEHYKGSSCLRSRCAAAAE